MSATWPRTVPFMARSLMTPTAVTWVVALALAAATLASNAATLPAQASVAQYLVDLAPWFVLPLAVLRVFQWIGVHVTSGVTRREFVVATLLVGLAHSVVSGLLAAGALELEASVFAANGWAHVAGDASSFDPSVGFAPVALALVPACVAADVSGLLLGLAYYRFGWVRGTALAPLALVPVLVVALGAGPLGRWQPLWFDHLDATSVGIVVVIVAAGVLVARLLARPTAIRAMA